MIQISAKEAIIPSGTSSGNTDRDLDLNKLKTLLDRCGIVVTERKPSMSSSSAYLPKVYSINRVNRRIHGEELTA